MRIAAREMKLDTERLLKKKTVSDIPLMTDFVREI
jgi:hypothetical protein